MLDGVGGGRRDSGSLDGGGARETLKYSYSGAILISLVDLGIGGRETIEECTPVSRRIVWKRLVGAHSSEN